MFKKLKFYLSPFFISRYYLLKDIRNTVSQFTFSWKTLDIWCGDKPYKSLFNHSEYIGIDFKDYSRNNDFKINKPDIYFDDTYNENYTLPIANQSFDNVVSFQVLEHHQKPDIFISESYRVLRDDGLLLITVPFLWWIHEEPYDFQRYTRYGLTEILTKHGFKIMKIEEQWSVFSVISLLLNEYLNNFAIKGKAHYIITIIVYPPFLMFWYIAIVLDRIFKSKKIFFNYLVVAQKHEFQEPLKIGIS